MTAKPPDGPAAPDGGGEALAEAHRALLADRSIQFELKPYEPTPPPEWLRWLADFLSSEHPLLEGLVWTVGGLVLLVLLFFLVKWLAGYGWGFSRSEGERGETWRPGEEPARALLGEADALAERGLFAEAVRLLLFRSIADLEARRPELVRPALTSRDIAALPAIPERPRGAFARIAMAVERSLFARRPLSEGDWRHCRAAYEEFAFAEGWRG